jgi:preprotein translocase subunit SecG
MLFYLATGIYVLVCLILMLVILLQQGKGGDIAAAFGGGGGSQTAFGARSGATVLSRATAVLAVLFILGALALGILGQRGPGSVIGGRAPQLPPATQLPAPAGAPAPAPPATIPTNQTGSPTPQAPAQTPAPAPAK